MEQTTLGRTGLRVTQLGYGAMEIRGPRVWNGRPVPDEDSARILNTVLDAGINFIDTSYDYGRSEELIGKYISHRRHEFILATKCGCTLVDHGDHDETPHVWTRDNVLHNIETSLRRMNTDYVDLLQLHGPTVRQAEEGGLIDALKEIQASGKARWIGISSYEPNLSGFIDWEAFDTFQIPYSALEREHEPWIAKASERGAGVIIRGGVGQGEPGHGRGAADRWAVWERANLDELMDEGETRTGFMLRYTLTNPHMDTTIVGTINPTHLADNLRFAAKGKLPADVYAEIQKRLDAAVATT